MIIPLNESSGLQCSVLVLNKAYVPIHVISAKRSVGLLYRDLAEVIHVDEGVYNNFDFETWIEFSEFVAEEKLPGDDWIRGTSFDLLVPRVLRLYRYDRIPKQSLRFNRRNLFARDEHTCQYCDRVFPLSQLSFDHVVPRSRGGETSWTNVVCCCIKCNSSKGNRTPSEANMKLRRKPGKPFFSPLISDKMANPKYEIWNSFIQPKRHARIDDANLVHSE